MAGSHDTQSMSVSLLAVWCWCGSDWSHGLFTSDVRRSTSLADLVTSELIGRIGYVDIHELMRLAE